MPEQVCTNIQYYMHLSVFRLITELNFNLNHSSKNPNLNAIFLQCSKFSSVLQWTETGTAIVWIKMNFNFPPSISKMYIFLNLSYLIRTPVNHHHQWACCQRVADQRSATSQKVFLVWVRHLPRPLATVTQPPRSRPVLLPRSLAIPTQSPVQTLM